MAHTWLWGPGQEEKLSPPPSLPIPRLAQAHQPYRDLSQVTPQEWPGTAKPGSFLDGRRSEGETHHIIQDTSTIVASLKELKKRMSSSPSEPSFFRATPSTRAKRTNPKMFIPSISVPMGICRIRGDSGSKFTTDEWELKMHHFVSTRLKLCPKWEKTYIFLDLQQFHKSGGRKLKG